MSGWAGVDWAQAPEWATHWVMLDLPPGSNPLALWSAPSMRFIAAPTFGYTGHPRDSLTARPQQEETK